MKPIRKQRRQPMRLGVARVIIHVETPGMKTVREYILLDLGMPEEQFQAHLAAIMRTRGPAITRWLSAARARARAARQEGHANRRIPG